MLITMPLMSTTHHQKLLQIELLVMGEAILQEWEEGEESPVIGVALQ
jgi:hypothetical protein